jgi:hypothetical protein
VQTGWELCLVFIGSMVPKSSILMALEALRIR